ncbi:MAG: UPF0280 family protein [Bacillota bacterium]
MYREIAPGKVLLDYGPISMVIEASTKGSPMTAAAVTGAVTAIRQLEELSAVINRGRVLASRASIDRTNPAVLNSMIGSAQATGEPDITPMAAVAGAIADRVLEAVTGQGATRVIVNNGGDIAFRLEPGTSMRVGVVTDLTSGKITHFLDLREDYGLGGIATSGFGGRSFTKGISSAVVTLARNAALADACATMIANAVNADHPEIIRVPAEHLDPLTDISGQMVTAGIGRIDPPTVQRAILAGKNKFFEYRDKGLLFGSLIALQGHLWTFPDRIAKPIRQNV